MFHLPKFVTSQQGIQRSVNMQRAYPLGATTQSVVNLEGTNHDLVPLEIWKSYSFWSWNLPLWKSDELHLRHTQQITHLRWNVKRRSWP